MNRRTWLGGVAGMGMARVASGGGDEPRQRALPEPTAAKLPRWKGFNLLEMFMSGDARPFVESDFAMIAELGFDFVRLPLDYRSWIKGGDWTTFREDRLAWVDDALRYGKAHGVHVQLNFHRAPGYTVADPAEAKSVWTDSEALDVCVLHWTTFARRYRAVPNRELSFNLFNEPARVEAGPHQKVVARLVREIQAHNKSRLIVCDGRDWGTKPPTELVGLGVAAATRGYAPFHLTHYKATWVGGSENWPTPKYPLTEGGKTWDETTLVAESITPWKLLQREGVGVMVGEFGAYNKTPHDVVIPWMRDCVSAWNAAGWGYALWNFRGPFGVLDSDRGDVSYESWRGHKLDRAMLEVLKAE